MMDNQLSMRIVARLKMMALFMMLLSLSGCIQMHTTVHVSRDGSGTIEERMLFTGMFAAMMNNGQSDGSPDKGGMLPKEERLRESAAGYGPDVRVVNVKPFENRSGKGFMTTYAFDDIEKVRIGNMQKTSMSFSADSTSTKADSTSTGKPDVWFSFSMKRGAHPELFISKQTELHTSSGKVSDSAPAVKGSEKDQKQALDMMTPFLKGMKMVLDVVVDGRIISTDATFRTGNRITLYSMDFDRLLARPDLLSGKYDGLSDREFSRKSGKNSGLRFELKDRVRVVFH